MKTLLMLIGSMISTSTFADQSQQMIRILADQDIQNTIKTIIADPIYSLKGLEISSMQLKEDNTPVTYFLTFEKIKNKIVNGVEVADGEDKCILHVEIEQTANPRVCHLPMEKMICDPKLYWTDASRFCMQ